MMSTKHTPGPWRVSYTNFSEVKAENGARIAKCDKLNGLVNLQANSRLVAAAPELLEALQSIAEYWNRDQNETAMADACRHAIETAMAAITKATGDQQ